MNKRNGRLIVMSGPSGAGKGSIIQKYMAQNSDCVFSVSATTRPPRTGEEDKVHYYFIEPEEFLRLLESGGMLEYTVYNGNYYGTPRSYVEEVIGRGQDMILDIEVNGGMQVKANYPNALMIFVLPPSYPALEERLKGRGSENDQSVVARLETAKAELAKAWNYDYILINDDLDAAVEDFRSIIKAERCRRENNPAFLREFSRQLAAYLSLK